MTGPVDHYGAAEAELERADHARAAVATGREEAGPRQWQHIARAGVHALLALVDALDDAREGRQ